MAVNFSLWTESDLTAPPPDVSTRVGGGEVKPLLLPPTLNWFMMDRGWWIGDTEEVLAPLCVGRRHRVERNDCLIDRLC